MLSTLINYTPLSLLSNIFSSNSSIIKCPSDSDLGNIKVFFIKDEGVIHNNRYKEITLAIDSVNRLMKYINDNVDNSSNKADTKTINDTNTDDDVDTDNDTNNDDRSNDKFNKNDKDNTNNENDVDSSNVDVTTDNIKSKICILSNNSSLIPSVMKEKMIDDGLTSDYQNINIMTTAGLVCYKINELVLHKYRSKEKTQVRIGFVGGKKLYKIIKKSLSDKNTGKGIIYRIVKDNYIPKKLDYILVGCVNKKDENLNTSISKLISENSESEILIYNETKNKNLFNDENYSYDELISKFNINPDKLNQNISIYNYDTYFDKMKQFYNYYNNKKIMIVSNDLNELLKFHSDGYKTCLTLTDTTTYENIEKLNDIKYIDYIIPDLSLLIKN